MSDQDFHRSTVKRYSKKSELIYSPKKVSLGNQHKKNMSLIARDLSHFVHARLPDCGVLKVLRSMPEGVRLQNNITQSVRSKDRVNYVALNNPFSADFETASKGKRKYKPRAQFISSGETCQQVEIVIDSSP